MRPVSKAFEKTIRISTRVFRRNDGSERPWTLRVRSEGGTTDLEFTTLSEAVRAWKEYDELD